MIAPVGKGIDRAHGMSKKESTGKITAVGVTVVTRPISIHKYRSLWACHVVGTRGVIFPVVQDVRAVGIFRLQSSPRGLFDARVPIVLTRRRKEVRCQKEQGA